jgi:hypothetical protein
MKLIKRKDIIQRKSSVVIKLSSSGKKISNSTYVHKSAKEAPGHKTWKIRLTLILCSHATGHMMNLCSVQNESGLSKIKAINLCSGNIIRKCR